jgi:hypothetical protein
MAKVLAAVIAAALSGTASASPDELKPLEARYRIASGAILDPPPDEQKDRVAIYIGGRAAADIFEAMPAQARTVCDDQTLRAKTAGGLTCVRSQDGETDCSVAITLDQGRTEAASVC